MKTIIFRTLWVLLILAVCSASLVSALSQQSSESSRFWAFLILTYVSLWLTESFDSQLRWRLVKVTHNENGSVVWGYLVGVLVSTATFYGLLHHCKEISVTEHPYILGLVIYFGAVTFFMFRYLVITAKAVTRNIEGNSMFKNNMLAIDFNR